jgi:glycosyltransferase involved in cell wall biosynthesis
MTALSPLTPWSNMPEPLVSFLVPCFNYARFLPDCLNSILAQQEDVPFEVIVIDDASTDDTASVIAQYAAQDPRIRPIYQSKNLGHAGTINAGLPLTRGTYVARIDPDDRYRPTFLSVVLPKLAQFPRVGAVYGDAAVIDSDGIVTVASSDRVHDGRDFHGNELASLLVTNFVCAPTLIARRECWIDALPVPEHLAFNDWYFTVTMARTWNFYYVAEVVADYRVHRANHHTEIARNRSEEASILWLLNRVYAEPESDPQREQSKRAVRRAAYARHSVEQADKYFGFAMDADARRCYLRALRFRPQLVLNAGVIRRFTATLVGRSSYEMAKRVTKSAIRQIRHSENGTRGPSS